MRRWMAALMALLMLLNCAVLPAMAEATAAPQENSQPPERPEGGMPGRMDGDETGGYVLSGALTVSGEERTYDGSEDGEEIASETADENGVLAMDGAKLTISHVSLSKAGDSEDSDATDFYAVNAAVAAKSGSTIEIADAVIESAARGANSLFASGKGSVIYAKSVSIHSTGDNSRGLDATYGGTVVAQDLEIATEGAHSGAVATDRGNGFISIADSTLSTAGQGSPLIYSTGVVEAYNVTGEATGAQIVGMEGMNTVRLFDCALTGSGEKASEPVANGVFLYQSMSGDSSEGEALFEAQNSTLTSKISGGAMFYVTNTRAEVVLEHTALEFDSEANRLIVVGGNDSNGWGMPGQNGGRLKFTAIGEALSGDVVCDGISSAQLVLTGGTTYTGAVLRDDTWEGDGAASLYLSADSTWVVRGDSVLDTLSVPEGATVVDAQGGDVTIVDTDGTVLQQGGDTTVTVNLLSEADASGDAGRISDAEIDRSHFVD